MFSYDAVRYDVMYRKSSRACTAQSTARTVPMNNFASDRQPVPAIPCFRCAAASEIRATRPTHVLATALHGTKHRWPTTKFVTRKNEFLPACLTQALNVRCFLIGVMVWPPLKFNLARVGTEFPLTSNVRWITQEFFSARQAREAFLRPTSEISKVWVIRAALELGPACAGAEPTGRMTMAPGEIKIPTARLTLTPTEPYVSTKILPIRIIGPTLRIM